MELNFATSARGYIYITIHSDDHILSSGEIFGNSLDRVIPFDGDLGSLSGEKVILEFTFRDAELYSFRFFEQ